MLFYIALCTLRLAPPSASHQGIELVKKQANITKENREIPPHRLIKSFLHPPSSILYRPTRLIPPPPQISCAHLTSTHRDLKVLSPIPSQCQEDMTTLKEAPCTRKGKQQPPHQSCKSKEKAPQRRSCRRLQHQHQVAYPGHPRRCSRQYRW